MSRSKYHRLVVLREQRAALRQRAPTGRLLTALYDVEAQIDILEELHRRTGSEYK